MNKIVIIGAILGLLAISYTHCDDSVNGGTTRKAMEGIKLAANKGAKEIGNLADGITVHVERMTYPAPHVPGQHNLVASAMYGTGRLLRNITLETGDFAKSVASAGLNLGTKVPAAVIQTFKEAFNRIRTPRKKDNAPAKSDSSNDPSEPAAQDSATSKNAAAPEELQKNGGGANV